VFGEDDTDMNVDSVVNKEKGKGKEVPSQTIPPPNNRRTRPAIDPFAGYGDDLPGAPDALPEQPESKTLPPQPALLLLQKQKQNAVKNELVILLWTLLQLHLDRETLPAYLFPMKPIPMEALRLHGLSMRRRPESNH